MSLLNQIGGIASFGSLLLSKPAALHSGGIEHPVRAVIHTQSKPYRATENRRNYDAKVRLDRATSPVEPIQNDVIALDGSEWIIWRIAPSPAGSHWMLECMAPPTVAFIPVHKQTVSDGGGGFSTEWTADPDLLFYGKTREASIEGRLTTETAESLARLAISYPSAAAPADFGEGWRVQIDEVTYEILSVSVDDENPFWRNAILVTEGAA